MARQLSPISSLADTHDTNALFSLFDPDIPPQTDTIEDKLEAEAWLRSGRTGSDLSGPVEWIDDEMPRIWRKDI